MIVSISAALIALTLVLLSRLVRRGRTIPKPSQKAIQDAVRIRYRHPLRLRVIGMSERATLYKAQIGYLLAYSEDGKIAVEPVSLTRVVRNSTTLLIKPNRPWKESFQFSMPYRKNSREE